MVAFAAAGVAVSFAALTARCLVLDTIGCFRKRKVVHEQ